MLSTDLEVVADFACATGEAPLWHSGQGKVYWVDVDEGGLFCYDAQTGEADEVFRDGIIGGMTLNDDGRLALFMEKGAVKLWSPDGVEVVVPEIPAERDTRFNDVVADPRGRVFCGTMPGPSHEGRLYRLDPDGSLHLVLDEAGQPNGMDFSPDLQFFYFTDTMAGSITRFHYDVETGAIFQPERIVHIPKGEGVPDGLRVDEQGCIWSARWDGACLVRHDKAGQEMSRLVFPVQHVTSVTFDGTTAYVTTGGGKERPDGDRSGALFRFTSSVPGRPQYCSRWRAGSAPTGDAARR